jgi:hypothetical protein
MMKMVAQHPELAALPPGKNPVPIEKRGERHRRREKHLTLPEFEPWNVQSLT